VDNEIENGTLREIAGKRSVFYDGYWIKWYEPPGDSLYAKKRLIEALTRRLFNHVEHGINMPGNRLAEAIRAYEGETEPARKRVNGAMLAGALFNRAADIFTKLVELQELGVKISSTDTLMRECGQCLLKALEFGKTVRHRSGDESIDELWGEPFMAFSIPIEDFYRNRYIKIAQTMRDIDRIAEAMIGAFRGSNSFSKVATWIEDFAQAAKEKCETLRTDPVIFEVWPHFVVAGDRLSGFEPADAGDAAKSAPREIEDGLRLIEHGKELLTSLARARVPMPKSTQDYLVQCDSYRATYDHPGHAPSAVPRTM